MEFEDRTKPKPAPPTPEPALNLEPSEVLLYDRRWYAIDPGTCQFREKNGAGSVLFRNSGVWMEVFVCDTYGMRYREL